MSCSELNLIGYTSRVIVYRHWRLLDRWTDRERVELWARVKEADISKVQLISNFMSRFYCMTTSMTSFQVKITENTQSHSYSSLLRVNCSCKTIKLSHFLILQLIHAPHACWSMGGTLYSSQINSTSCHCLVVYSLMDKGQLLPAPRLLWPVVLNCAF